MKHIFKAFASYSAREQRGIFVLLFLLISLCIFRFSIPYLYPPEKADLSIVYQLDTLQSIKKKEYIRVAEQNNAKSVAYREFDPNTVSIEEWQGLGLSAKQAAVIHRYRQKGGHFYKKEDLQKMYCISSKQYALLEPYIRIKEKEAPVSVQKTRSFRSKVELNTADSTSLVAIPGIGPAFAKRIIRYRSRLGGYCNLNQLREVYGLDSARWEQVQSLFWIDTTVVQRLHINTADLGIIKAHPYLGYKLAQSWVNYRQQHGPFKRIEDIRQLALLDETTYLKIRPYLQLD